MIGAFTGPGGRGEEGRGPVQGVLGNLWFQLGCSGFVRTGTTRV